MDKQELSQLGGVDELDDAYLQFASSPGSDFLQVVNERLIRLGRPDLPLMELAEQADLSDAQSAPDASNIGR